MIAEKQPAELGTLEPIPESRAAVQIVLLQELESVTARESRLLGGAKQKGLIRDVEIQQEGDGSTRMGRHLADDGAPRAVPPLQYSAFDQAGDGLVGRRFIDADALGQLLL